MERAGPRIGNVRLLGRPLNDSKELFLEGPGAQAIKNQKLPAWSFLLQRSRSLPEFVRSDLVKKAAVEFPIDVLAHEVVFRRVSQTHPLILNI